MPIPHEHVILLTLIWSRKPASSIKIKADIKARTAQEIGFEPMYKVLDYLVKRKYITFVESSENDPNRTDHLKRFYSISSLGQIRLDTLGGYNLNKRQACG